MNRLEINLSNTDKVLVIHHWDCDGLCSAVLLHNYLEEIDSRIKVEYFLPEIGHYFLEEEDFEKVKKINPDRIFITDMALQKKDIHRLKDLTTELCVFDHHKQEKINGIKHINPFTDNNIDSLEYPSTGWVINNFFNKDQNLLSTLGAIGDQEEKIKDNPEVKRILSETGLSFDDCTNIVRNIDSYYILNNVEKIHYVLNFLKDNLKNIKTGLSGEIISNKKIIDEEINNIMDDGFSIDKKRRIIIKRIDSDFQVISNISRKIAKEFPDYLVIVINNNSSTLANIYFRNNGPDADLTSIMDYAKGKNYNAGGKKEVVGIFCPVSEVEEVVKDAIDI